MTPGLRRPILLLLRMTILGKKPAEVAGWAAAILFLGWGLPSIMGIVYTDPLLHLTYAGLTILFASPIVVERVYVDGQNVWLHVRDGVRFAMLSFLLMIAVDSLRAYRASGGNLLPEPGHIGRTAVIALAFAVFGAGVSAALASRVTRARTATQILRTGFLLALAGVVYGLRHIGADLQFELMSMVQPGGGWGMLTMVCGALMAAGVGLARLARAR